MRKLFTIFLVIVFVTACDAQDNKGYNTEEFVSKMGKDSSLVLLDVRTPPELKGPLGKIDGVINIPLQELDKRMDELNDKKDKEIVVICRSGRRSGIATEMLNKNGFNAQNLEGGMLGYRKVEPLNNEK